MKITKKLEKKIIETLKEIANLEMFSIKEMISNIKKYGHCAIDEDYSQFIEGKDRNGGCYGFWTRAVLKHDLKGYFFELEEHTTSDFEYCWKCGEFHNCYDCNREPVQIQIC